MKIPERLTFERTPYYAGLWHRVDGVDRYYTVEYIAYCQHRDRAERRVQHGAVRVQQAPRPEPKPLRPTAYTCEVCGQIFTVQRPRAEHRVCLPCRNRESRRASQRRRSAEQNAEAVTAERRVCEACGRPYRPKPHHAGRQRFCGKRCNNAWRIAQARKAREVA